MQEEVENRTLTLVVSGTKFTGRLFKAAISKYMAHRREKKLEKQRSRDSPVTPKGKQTVKQLIGQNQGVSNIEITDSNIKSFERVARKYECDPKTADAEFLFAKRQYQTITGREQRHDVIAYQVRQSFKPGEITPEDANRVGYEFAERFLKGRHAFFVATHTDKKHIHNHIIWNSTTLDCKHKFRDFLGSGRAVARLSDAICT